MIIRTLFRRTALAFGLTMGLVGVSQAATFSVSPLKVLLSKDKKTEVLTIINEGDKPLRLESQGMRWSQGDKDRLESEGKPWRWDPNEKTIDYAKWHLSDTDDLIIAPATVTVPAKGTAQLRVGTLVPPTDKEMTYRVLITEILDKSEAPGAGSGVLLRVRTQLNVPVFFDPPGISANPSIYAASRNAKTVSIHLHNAGTRRLDAQNVTADLLDGQGKTIETLTGTSSYALQDGSVELTLPAKPESCGKATQIRLTLNDPATTLTQPLPAAAQTCSGASS